MKKVWNIILILLGIVAAIVSINYAIYVMRVNDAQNKLKSDYALLDKIEEMTNPVERQEAIARGFLLRCPEIMGTGTKKGTERDLCKRAGEIYKKAKEESHAN